MSDHTCIKDDGGTPNRRCEACVEERKTQSADFDQIMYCQHCRAPLTDAEMVRRHRAKGHLVSFYQQTPRTLSAEEFEHLALMGQSPSGDLIVGEGGAERVLAHAKRLALSPDDVMDIYVPGRLRCPKCTFELTRATLFVKTGQVGASKAEVYIQGEPCPNDGTIMDRVTWREESDRNREYAEKLITEIIESVGAQSLPEAFELIKAARAEATASDAVQPGSTLNAAWERFSEEEQHAQVEIRAARRGFYAGAQTFVGIMNAALDDEIGDEDSSRQMEAAYKELEQAIEEMKL